MNPWQREQRRRNGVLFVFVASCLVFLFLVLNRVVGLTSWNSGGQIAAAGSVPDQKPAELREAKKKPKRARSGVLVQTGTQPDEAVAVREPKSVPPQAPASLEASVKTEPTLVYSSNTPRSSVVESLNIGDQVETNLEIVDSHGRWSLVRAKGQNRSGFVKTEDLERLQVEEQK